MTVGVDKGAALEVARRVNSRGAPGTPFANSTDTSAHLGALEVIMKARWLFAPLPVALALVIAAAPTRAQRIALDARIELCGAQVDLAFHDGYGGYGRGGVRVSPVRVHQPLRRTWVPGRYETVQERVWAPGASRKEWIEPVYETRYDSCGRPYRVLVSAGRWCVVQDPGHYEIHCRDVFVPGHWETVGSCR